MGNVYATNIVNDIIDEMNIIVNNVVQQCYQSINQNQVIDIINSGKINVGTFNIDQYAILNSTCVGSSNTQNQITTQIQQQISQISSAINQALSFNPGSTDSTNITDLLTNLADVISNSYAQTCSQVINQSQVFTFNNTQTGVVDQGVINMNQTANLLQNCTQNVTAVNNVTAQISQIISQKASSEVKGFLTQFVLIFIAIVIILILIMYGRTWKLILVLLFVLLIIIALIIFFYFWNKSKSNIPGDVKITSVTADKGQVDASTFLEGSTLKVQYTVNGTNGFQRVLLYDNGTDTDNNTNTTGTLNDQVNTPGLHNLYIQAIDKNNNTVNSRIVKITVLPKAEVVISNLSDCDRAQGCSLAGGPPTPSGKYGCPSSVNISERVNFAYTIQITLNDASITPTSVEMKYSNVQPTQGCYPSPVNTITPLPQPLPPIGQTISLTIPAVVKDTTSGQQYSNQIEAGSYTVQAILLDSGNNSLSSSTPITFTICEGPCPA